jgi:hypothetical protein
LVLPVLAAACSDSPREVASTPPAVSYEIPNGDLSQATARASSYCRQYGLTPQLQATQQSGSGRVASYSCVASGDGCSGVTAGSTVTPLPPCADTLHQNRPGGTDYKGPPIAACSPTD